MATVCEPSKRARDGEPLPFEDGLIFSGPHFTVAPMSTWMEYDVRRSTKTSPANGPMPSGDEEGNRGAHQSA